MTTDTPTADSPAKSTLFCPECGHCSPYDGDWRRVRRGRTVHYHCPDCDTEITTRPAERDDAGRTLVDVWQSWTTAVRAWQSAWTAAILRP